jgi:hydroxymethylglutaryl-CoA lyase
MARLAAAIGVSEISLSDTTGMGHPRQVYALCAAVRDAVPDVRVAAHLHDTRGAGAANVLAAVLAGADTIDGSIGGLGGCPFAPGASGNVCTEDMVNMLHDIGVATGVDLDGLLDAAHRAEEALGVTFRGQVLRAGPAFD